MNIRNQINQEYKEAFDYLSVRKQLWVKQLILFNNLARPITAVSSSLLPSLFQQLLGFFYNDKMLVKFQPQDEADYQKIENLNKYAEQENFEMKKMIIDYDSLWDSLFFGTGYVEVSKFDKTLKRVFPQVINPLSFFYDPYFSEPQNWRYYGKWILKPRHSLLKLFKKGEIYCSPDEIPDGVEENLWNYISQRDTARQGTPTTPTSLSPNRIYQILEFYTINEEGKRIRVWFDKNLNKCLKIDDKINQQEWEIVVRKVTREPHTNLTTSKVDMIEDKHRAQSVLLNLINIKATDYATPIYEYNTNLVKDKSVFLSRQINQHIPVEAIGAIAPLSKEVPVDSPMLAYLSLLEGEAGKASGAAGIAFPAKRKMSATEAALRQQVSEVVSSVDIKLLMSSEIEFWSQWYRRYHENLKEGDELKVRIISPEGHMKFESLKRKDIISERAPSVLVVSSTEKEYKELVLRRDLMQQLPIFTKTLPPHALKNFLKYFYLPKFVPDVKMLDVIYPKSIEEIKAEQENAELERNILARIDQADEDETHLYIHYRASNTAAKWAHIFAHEYQHGLKKLQQPEQPQVAEGVEPELLETAGGRREVPQRKRMQEGGLVPLKEEMAREIFGGQPVVR